MKELSPKAKGDVSELKVLARLAELDIDMFIPYGENSAADVVIDNSGLERVQIKTARSTGDGDRPIMFNCRSTKSNYTEIKSKDYEGDIEAFIVYWDEDSEFYYVPIDSATGTTMTIRRKPTQNNQTHRVNFAEEYNLSEHLGQ